MEILHIVDLIGLSVSYLLWSILKNQSLLLTNCLSSYSVFSTDNTFEITGAAGYTSKIILMKSSDLNNRLIIAF